MDVDAAAGPSRFGHCHRSLEWRSRNAVDGDDHQRYERRCGHLPSRSDPDDSFWDDVARNSHRCRGRSAAHDDDNHNCSAAHDDDNDRRAHDYDDNGRADDDDSRADYDNDNPPADDNYDNPPADDNRRANSDDYPSHIDDHVPGHDHDNPRAHDHHNRNDYDQCPGDNVYSAGQLVDRHDGGQRGGVGKPAVDRESGLRCRTRTTRRHIGARRRSSRSHCHVVHGCGTRFA